MANFRDIFKNSLKPKQSTAYGGLFNAPKYDAGLFTPKPFPGQIPQASTSAVFPKPITPTRGALVDRPQDPRAAYKNTIRPTVQPVASSVKSSTSAIPTINPQITNVQQSTVAPVVKKTDLQLAQEELDKFNASKNRGLEGINQKVIPLEFQTGQKAALERNAALTGTELETRLAREEAAAAAEAEKNKPIQLGEGESLFDPATGKVIYKAPKTYAPGSGSGGIGNELLSISEAKQLGVPYGTTRAQAIGKRSLNPTQLEAQTNANSALLSLQNLTNAIAKPEGGYSQGKLFNLGLGKVGFAERELRDVITRIRTGAALSENEESFYKKQVPRTVDSDETIQTKVNQLAAFYAGIAGSPVTLELPDGNVVVADDMYDPETRTDVRQAIANGANVISY